MERKRSVGKRAPVGAAVFQSRVTNALYRAVFVEWAAVGYGGIRLERVAARARVGKAALYRRWPSKAHLVSEALEIVALTITGLPDTGSLRGDLEALLRQFRKTLRRRLVRCILPDLHAEANRSTALSEVIQKITSIRRERGMILLERAISRGELASETNLQIAADLLAAPIYWRMVVVGGEYDDRYIDQLATMLIAGLGALRGSD